MLISHMATRSARHAALVGLLAAMACNTEKLLEVQTPDIITPGSVNNASGAEALRARAVGAFAELINGNLGLATTGALLADELASGRTQLDYLDNRTFDPTQDYNFSTWASAKNGAERAAASLLTYLPEGDDRDTKVGHMHALNGMTLILGGEHWCNGIPIGSVVDGELVFEEQPLLVQEVFERAVAQFDSALQLLPASAVNERNLARVGKARALLNMDQPAAAAAVVSAGGDPAGAVPTSFVWLAEFSALSIGNGLYDWIPASGNFAPTHHEGSGNHDSPNGAGVGLDYIWSNDPRLRIETPHFRSAQDGSTHIYRIHWFDNRDDPLRAASGVEARLIEAEADLRAGDGSWLTTLNDLRATAISPSLDPLADPGSESARVDMLFRERAFWMYLTAHRLGDMRRLVRQYGRAIDEVYPSGQYFKGGSYGSSVVFEVSTNERNRPAGSPPYTGCTNFDP